MQSNASDPSSGIQARFAGEFVEGSSVPRVNRTRDAPKPSDGAYILGSHAFERVWHPPDRVGLVVDISMDNLWHVLFHALPTRELVLEQGLELSSIDFLPRYTTFWPVANCARCFRCSRAVDQRLPHRAAEAGAAVAWVGARDARSHRRQNGRALARACGAHTGADCATALELLQEADRWSRWLVAGN
jgi:hypothetical protein